MPISNSAVKARAFAHETIEGQRQQWESAIAEIQAEAPVTPWFVDDDATLMKKLASNPYEFLASPIHANLPIPAFME